MKPLSCQIRGRNGPTTPCDMNRKKYRTHPSRKRGAVAASFLAMIPTAPPAVLLLSSCLIEYTHNFRRVQGGTLVTGSVLIDAEETRVRLNTYTHISCQKSVQQYE